ncbi:MAG TPA: 16S rRNA (cytosine(967)-C(5))-methyltransferase RsmB [Pyrinomonadaceae bacterium]|nr:16S rRNA (cytosine(967)-C(5))-methyltransferase RsmB [Pyrinomonadaceae bacterium]
MKVRIRKKADRERERAATSGERDAATPDEHGAAAKRKGEPKRGVTRGASHASRGEAGREPGGKTAAAGKPRGKPRDAGARAEAAQVSPARRVAFEVLRRVEEESAFASVLLAHVTAELRADDRALCYELTLGVLRRLLWLDKLIEHYAGSSVASLDAAVARSLRLGLYQLRFLSRVPASAAVNESVNLTHSANLRPAAGLVNAVLRRATREPDFDPAARAGNEIERISVAHSHPAWLVERWAAAFGAGEAGALASANNRTPPAAFRVNPLRARHAEVIERLRAAGVEAEPSRVAEGAWRVAAGRGGEVLRALAHEGVVYTQDEASQLVGRVLGAREGERVLDVCAAPGSKATQVAALTRDRAEVVAGDLYDHRLRVVAESAVRQGIGSIRVVALDAEGAALPFAEESFDRALVDAPCTGTGTLRHNPEIRWRLAPADIAELAARQSRILANAARVVRRGGRLVYSTCSVEPEENESVVAAFLKSHKDFRQARADVPEGLLTTSGAARTWPHRDDTDGFYVAVLERES